MDIFEIVRELLAPITTRVSNIVARGVVHRTNDSAKLQTLQVGVMASETVDDVEHFQPYGFGSVPENGAEAVALFPNGDRGHPLAVAVADRRYRPTGHEPGEVFIYHKSGAKLLMNEDGDIEIQPATGRKVYVRTSGGSAEPVVLKSEFDAHTHSTTATVSSGSVGVIGAPDAVTGSQAFETE